MSAQTVFSLCLVASWAPASSIEIIKEKRCKCETTSYNIPRVLCHMYTSLGVCKCVNGKRGNMTRNRMNASAFRDL